MSVSKRKKIAKLVLPALMAAVLASALLFGLPAFAAPGDAKDMDVGCWVEGHRWITFGEYDGKPLTWRILETNKTDQGGVRACLKTLICDILMCKAYT